MDIESSEILNQIPNLETIPEPSPRHSDDMSIQEELDLTPTEGAKLWHKRMVRQLQSDLKVCRQEIDEYKVELRRLRPIAEVYASLKTKDGILKKIILIGAAASTLGGLMIGNDSIYISSAGYCIGVIGLVISTTVSLWS